MTQEPSTPTARKDDRTDPRMPASKLDLVALALTCALPTEARLAVMLDRIEALR